MLPHVILGMDMGYVRLQYRGMKHTEIWHLSGYITPHGILTIYIWLPAEKMENVHNGEV